MDKQLRVRDVKLIPIGNSKGIEFPRPSYKYGLNNSIA